MSKPHAVASEPVDIWGLIARSPVRRDDFVTHVVGQDQDDIRLLHVRLGAGVYDGQKEEGREDEDSALAPVMGVGRVPGSREAGPQGRRQDGEKDKEGPNAP